MLIEIDTSVANDPDAHSWLDRVIYTVMDGWHIWNTADHVDSSEFEATTWIRDRGTQGDKILELFKKSNKSEAWKFDRLHTKRICVTTSPSDDSEFEPEDAAQFVMQPLCILMENEFSDGSFLKRTVRELDKSLSDHWNQDRRQPIEIDSVGGVTQMPRAVKQKITQNSVRTRLIVIADSDKKYPSDQESKGARKLRNICEENNIPCWILAKRAAENYLPSILLKAWKPNDQEYIRAVYAWERLCDDQKNFFDMKRGFPGNDDDDQNPLFEGVPEEDYILLTNRFGGKVYKCWEYATDVNIESELRARSQGDLEYGINLIREEV